MKTKRRPKEYKQQGNNAQLKQIKTITRKDKTNGEAQEANN